MLPKHRQDFQDALRQWYAVARRPLPWRVHPSLYGTVVSELMAQQTQIKTMLPYYDRWMERFPDFAALAAAPESAVLKHWEGLGYYSRARNLHRLAQAWVAADPKPRTREDWQALPGIGPYTSAAIASINFGQPVAVVDGNVVRILARLTGDDRSFKSNAEAVKAFTPLAGELVDVEQPGDHNQAMMELGATICLKRKPLCTVCPVQRFCRGRDRADLDALPRIERRATEQVETPRAWISDSRGILLYRIPESAGQLAGQYELPRLDTLQLPQPPTAPLATKVRSITHRRIREPIYQFQKDAALARRIDENSALSWVAWDQLADITLSGPHRKWIEALQTSLLTPPEAPAFPSHGTD